MITSSKQYMAAKEKAKTIKEELCREIPSNYPDVIKNLIQDQSNYLLKEIEGEIADYELMHFGTLFKLQISSYEDLLKAPIRYRICRGLTIEEFANLVGIHSRQIARYELEEYKNITTDTFSKILQPIGIIFNALLLIQKQKEDDQNKHFNLSSGLFGRVLQKDNTASASFSTGADFASVPEYNFSNNSAINSSFN